MYRKVLRGISSCDCSDGCNCKARTCQLSFQNIFSDISVVKDSNSCRVVDLAGNLGKQLKLEICSGSGNFNVLQSLIEVIVNALT